VFWRFRIGGPSKEEEQARIVNELLVEHTVSAAVDEFHATQPPEPKAETVHHPVDPSLQPGESAKLGGAMEIRGPWER
jgi:hypothetical protein